jgi:hypothetical protein
MQHSKTSKQLHACNTDFSHLTPQQITTFNTGISKRSDLTRSIEQLRVSADAKAILVNVLDTSLRVGRRVLALGRKILDAVFYLARTYPQTTFGGIVACVLSLLITSIPIVGVLLGPILTPVFIAFGLGAGAVNDMRDHALKSRLRILEDELSLLKEPLR